MSDDPKRVTSRRALRIAQWTCLFAGSLLSGFYALALVDGEVGQRADLDAFAAGIDEPDQSLWDRTRIEEYAASKAQSTGPVVAVLRIPSLDLTVPVYPDQSDLHLNRGVGLVSGSGSPDKGGNAAIAGHRDGFFRVLQNAKAGEIIEIRTRLAVHRYRVFAIDIVDKQDNRLLADTAEPAITLVTCYPFYFVGAAPQRYLVRAAYIWPEPAPRVSEL